MSDNSSLYFSSRTTMGSQCCIKLRTTLPPPSRSTKICFQRKTINNLITCRTSDFSVKGFCVMMETEENSTLDWNPGGHFHRVFWEQWTQCKLWVQLVMYSMSVYMQDQSLVILNVILSHRNISRMFVSVSMSSVTMCA